MYSCVPLSCVASAPTRPTIIGECIYIYIYAAIYSLFSLVNNKTSARAGRVVGRLILCERASSSTPAAYVPRQSTLRDLSVSFYLRVCLYGGASSEWTVDGGGGGGSIPSCIIWSGLFAMH